MSGKGRREPLSEQCLTVLDNAMDTGMTVAGPVFVVLAISLFITCMWAFYVAVFGEAFWDRCPNSVRVIHGTLAIWVCFNILFNYIMCVRTAPGSTVEVSTQDLLSVYPPPERWCQKCEKPKPALAHHCSVCKRCVLCMDHHCPWVNNCVGHKNYRYFFLFLFYLTFACAYAFPVLIRRYGYRLVPSIGPIKFQRPKTIQQVRAAHHFSALLALMLCMCVVLVVGGMLLWHVYLVLTAQGTIDVHSNRSAARTARAKGKTWKNVFDLGYKRNWQERFDCRGRFWWVDWLLPRLSPPKSNGYQHVIAKTSLEWASSAV